MGLALPRVQRLGLVQAALHEGEVPLPVRDVGQLAGRLSGPQQLPEVVHKHEPVETWRAPHELERDPGLELDVRDVVRRAAVASVRAGAPAPPLAQGGVACGLYVRPQLVALADGRHRPVGVVVVLDVPQHRAQVAVVVVVEGVARRGHDLQAAGKQQTLPDTLPFVVQCGLREAPDPTKAAGEAGDGRAGVVQVARGVAGAVKRERVVLRHHLVRAVVADVHGFGVAGGSAAPVRVLTSGREAAA
mmetsp:Transcript_68278/g.192503  ORF Transcript_68278/g.192503 Transcript_68278/m.192503 type:complete len:246 (-) Transcript_68278:14-751(-)|eukprot:CAMPEP_0179239552 /NCGR_PEP_ID=MMETSP0797-20121207/15520_1 /TAXON_ID=47934 /ORGANISM="Dinophysis acuminata, Strain DAEP01" /LENGTH=245 /DNA_ID=CAMNT_0020946879 /DNA_START=162 /DNA_END=899 /DNA_ORIENTATION=-